MLAQQVNSLSWTWESKVVWFMLILLIRFTKSDQMICSQIGLIWFSSSTHWFNCSVSKEKSSFKFQSHFIKVLYGFRRLAIYVEQYHKSHMDHFYDTFLWCFFVILEMWSLQTMIIWQRLKDTEREKSRTKKLKDRDPRLRELSKLKAILSEKSEFRLRLNKREIAWESERSGGES